MMMLTGQTKPGGGDGGQEALPGGPLGPGEDRRGGAGVQSAGQQVHHGQLQPAHSREVSPVYTDSGNCNVRQSFTEITPS